jgi:hypothetical protein
MIGGARAKRDLSQLEKQIMREHWEWGSSFALIWIIATILIFGAFYALFDVLNVDDRVRIPALVLLSTVTIVNAIWRAVGALVARLELMRLTREKSDPGVSPENPAVP